MAERRINPFQPSTSPWDDSFTASGSRGTIIFPSAVPPNASPMVPVVKQTGFNIAGVNSPPASPSYWEATVIQIPFDSYSSGTIEIRDQRFNLAGNVGGTSRSSISTAAFRFGGASLYVDGGSVSYGGARFSTNTLFDLGASDFTIEGWVKSSQVGQYACLACRTNNDGAVTGWRIQMNLSTTSDGKIGFLLAEYSTSAYFLTGTVKHNDNIWHHVAVTRLGTTWSLYVDGIREATAILSATMVSSGTDLAFGGGTGFAQTLNGYLDEWRIVRGVCVYSGASFAVPTVPFPTT